MHATVLGFTKSNQNPAYDIVIIAGETKHDDFLGLDVNTGKRYYLCAKHYRYKKLIGKEVELTLQHSEKLKQDVCIDILVKADEKKPKITTESEVVF